MEQTQTETNTQVAKQVNNDADKGKNAIEDTQPDHFTGRMITQLLSLAILSFCLGMSQFIVVGILPSVASWLVKGGMSATNASQQAAQMNAFYSLGICIGLFLLLLARTVSAKVFMIVTGSLIVISNLLTFIFGLIGPSAFIPLLITRLIAGLPHGSFFGVSSLLAPQLSPRGKAGRGLSIVVTGQTVADIIGIPVGIALANSIGWVPLFLIIVGLSALATILCACTIPSIHVIPRTGGKKGAVRSSMRHAPFWLGIVTIFCGGVSFFSWYTYVSQWATQAAGFSTDFEDGIRSTIWLLAVAGIGMFVGSLLSGHLSDALTAPRSLVVGLAWQTIALVAVGLIAPRQTWIAYLLVFITTCSLFFVSGTPAQLVSNTLTGHGLAGGVLFNLSLNAGNMVGTEIGGRVFGATGTYLASSLTGAGIGLIAVIACIVLTVLLEHTAHQQNQ
jgi:DHA1 family arabinose polymer transporter-like MFS transporter